MGRPTAEDARLRSWLLQTIVALLIAGVLLVIAFIYLFKRLLP